MTILKECLQGLPGVSLLETAPPSHTAAGCSLAGWGTSLRKHYKRERYAGQNLTPLTYFYFIKTNN